MTRIVPDVDEFEFDAEIPWEGVRLTAVATGVCQIDCNDGAILRIWLATLERDRPRYLLTEGDGELYVGVCAILEEYQDVIDDMVREFHRNRADDLAAERADAEYDRHAVEV